MIQRLRFFILVSIFAFFGDNAKLSAQEYSWKYYSVADGLPQTQITSLFQDSKGYIWIGTKGGLSKFDGIAFENYTVKDGLIDDFVTEIQEDSIGTLFISTKYGAHIMKDGMISSIPLFKNTLYPQLLIDKTNRIWVKQRGLVLTCIEDGKKVNQHPLIGYLDKHEKIMEHASNIKSGEIIFLSSKNRLIIWDGKRANIIENNSPNSNPYFGKDGALYGITLDSIFNFKNGAFHLLLSTKFYNVKYINSKNDIYLTDKETYSNLFHFDGKTITEFHQKFNMITSVFVDDEENLWVGTESGLWRLQSKGFRNYLTDPKNNHYTWNVLQDNKDNYWFGSFLHGMKKYDGTKFTNISVDHLFKKNEFQNFYSGGIKGKRGDLLFAAFQGVVKYDGKSLDWFYYENPGTVVYIYEDRKNDNLYFSSAKNGIIEMDSQQKIRYYHDRDKKENTGLVTSILKDKYDRLWISGELGICIRENETWRNLPDAQDSIDIGAISMQKDNKGNLWFGSSDGLYFYDYKQLRKVAGDVFNGQIGILNIAKSGELLIGSIKGIGLLDLEKYYETGTEAIRYFDNQNGFLGTECKHNSSFNDNDGNTWVCTSDRVVKVNTDELKSNPSAPRVYINSISTLSEDMLWKSVQKTSNDDKNYSFGPDENDIRFNYQGISHSAPSGVMYQTMLVGHDESWSAITNERYRTYTNLPQGDFKFRVKAANIDGIWSDEIANSNIVIMPAWHELLSVKVGGLFALLFVATGFGYLFSESKRRRKLKVEYNEKKIAKLQFKSLQGLIDPHFTFNAINSIASMVYKENRDEAYQYFTKFSKLIRTVFDDSEATTRTIREELTFVKHYLDIEKMRFKDRFEYNIEIDRTVNKDWKIPKMIVQIYVENAIKHGLVPKEFGGKLDVVIGIKSGDLCIQVNDNGIGRMKSESNKSKIESLGRGTKILDGYFILLNKFNTEKIKSEIIDAVDAQGNPSGTQVTVFIPLNFKYNL